MFLTGFTFLQGNLLKIAHTGYFNIIYIFWKMGPACFSQV